MKKYIILFLYTFNLLSSDYSDYLKTAINSGDTNQVNYYITNHGPFDRSIYDAGLLSAATSNNMELFNLLSPYADRRAHRRVAKLKASK